MPAIVLLPAERRPQLPATQSDCVTTRTRPFVGPSLSPDSSQLPDQGSVPLLPLYDTLSKLSRNVLVVAASADPDPIAARAIQARSTTQTRLPGWLPVTPTIRPIRLPAVADVASAVESS